MVERFNNCVVFYSWTIIILALLAGCTRQIEKEFLETPKKGEISALPAPSEARQTGETKKESWGEQIEAEIEISSFDPLVKKYSRRYGFDWILISAQVFAESSFRPDVISSKGARGLMQIMPGTARWLGVEPDLLLEPEQNISLGIYYDWHILQRIYGAKTIWDKLSFMFASYNCGPGCVKKRRKAVGDGSWLELKDELPTETQRYVPRIWKKYSDYRKEKL